MSDLTLSPVGYSLVLSDGSRSLTLTSNSGGTLALGVPGIQGPPGAGGHYFQHVQSSAAAVWTVNHNLGARTNVAVFSPGGVEVEAAVLHVSDNQTTISFNTPQTGSAVFS